jgi:hypothetical protein
LTDVSRPPFDRCDNAKTVEPESNVGRLGLRGWAVGALVAAWLAGPMTPGMARADDAAGFHATRLDAAAAAEVRALDCRRVPAADVARLLVKGPTPRIILFQGSLAIMTMEPFADFLVAMGYPQERIRDPRDGRLSQGSFGDSRRWAGTVAWYFESEGMMPMLIGHSQGGMIAIRILYELDGAWGDDIPVWDPVADVALPRFTIRDPRTGAARPVKGLRVDYAAAMATGKLPRILLGQWDMIARLRRIPDTVADFTGFSIPWDAIAGTLGDPEPYAAIGTAHVRNVTLPSRYSHVGLPNTLHLATHEVTRRWIDEWSPDSAAPPPEADGVDSTNIVHAADIWYSVKQHWCQAAQRVLGTGDLH